MSELELIFDVEVAGVSRSFQNEVLRVRPPVEVFANDVQLNSRDEATDRFVPISTEPAMPVITISNNMDEEIRGRLKIEYTKNYNGQTVRKWLDYYPEEENDEVQTQTIDAHNSWNVDFGDDIRGGTAIFEYVTGENEWNDDNIQTFTFYLRGRNPNRDEVISYIEDEGYDDQYWFLIRLIRHESATGSSNEFRQYNPGTNYTTTSVRGLPNFGPPRGYGLGQIDNFGRLVTGYSALTEAQREEHDLVGVERGETIVDDEGRTIDWQGYIVASDNQVWNWKENIDTVITFLDIKKQTIINKYTSWVNTANNWNTNHPEDLVEQHADQVEGDITFSSIESFIDDIPNNVNEYFDDVEDSDTTKSFIDACLIRYYNGGYYHRLRRNGNQKPYWDIDRESTQSGFYVEHICSQDE